MTAETTTALEVVEGTDHEKQRKAALIRAIGLDKVSEGERELALAIAKRYDLDLLLKHLVLIDGRVYVTRDALLWVAHRSGQLDGMISTPPEIREFPELGKCWYSETTVWRKDMKRPFTYGGRYPVTGQNKRYGPEMAVKVSECMTLRRAFNVSAPIVEERWDQGDIPTTEPEAPKSLADRAKERVAAIKNSGGEPSASDVGNDSERSIPEPPDQTAKPVPPPGTGTEAGAVGATTAPASPSAEIVCDQSPAKDNPLGMTKPCNKLEGHTGPHACDEGSWPA